MALLRRSRANTRVCGDVAKRRAQRIACLCIIGEQQAGVALAVHVPLDHDYGVDLLRWRQDRTIGDDFAAIENDQVEP